MPAWPPPTTSSGCGDRGYRYLVVSRERIRRFDPDLAEAIETRSGQKVHLHSVIDEETGERRLYCHSEERAHKEEGIAHRFAARFEGFLARLHEGLSRPRTRKGLDHVWRSIGRISERSRGIAQHYKVDVVADPETGKATAVTWEKKPVAGTMLTHPGVYCLRTNVIDWDQEALWRTYTMLTDLESVFRSLKSELGLRPVLPPDPGPCRRPPVHHRPCLPDGADHPAGGFASMARLRAWATLRRTLAGQQRVTATFRRKDGRTLHLRKATLAEPDQLRIYTALGLDPQPRQGLENGRLITRPCHNGHECSARHPESAFSTH